MLTGNSLLMEHYAFHMLYRNDISHLLRPSCVPGSLLPMMSSKKSSICRNDAMRQIHRRVCCYR